MNQNLFKNYYQTQLDTMETNVPLRDAVQDHIMSELTTTPKHRQAKRTWITISALTASCAVLAAGIVMFNLKPQTVTADALLQKALATPTLQPGQIYQTSYTRTGNEFLDDGGIATATTYHTNISDGTHLEEIVYDDQHHITAAELAIPHGSDNTVYDVYSYGDLRQVRQADDLNVIEHRLVYNADTFKNVSADDPTTFANAPEGWSYSYGKNSILEMVSGSSFWRPYLNNDNKGMAFFVEPVITETTLDGTEAYKLDEKQPDIDFEMIGWIAKEDGRLLQEQTVTSNTIPGDLTVYDTPTITIGTMPTTVTEFTTQLYVANPEIIEATLEDFGANGDIVIMDGDLDGGYCEPNSVLPETTAIPNCSGQ